MSTEPRHFHTLTPEAVFAALDTGPRGLSEAEAAERLERHGPNQLAAGKKISAWGILLRQFANLLITILLAATVISFFLGESLDAWVILAIVLACVVLGFVQEYRAEQAAAALQKLAAPVATVVRDGKERAIPAREVVPGDVLVLHTGDRVAADARLLEEVNLKADEALLTGESTAAGKNLAPATDPEPRPGRPEVHGLRRHGDHLWPGPGRGYRHRHGHGVRQDCPHVGGRDRGPNPPGSPHGHHRPGFVPYLPGRWRWGLQLLGVFRGHCWLEMLIWGISLAVAAVPESLPAVVTGALAIGTTRMARRNAIVKRLPAVETMGCTTVICTDKTGTLTKNEMTVRRLFLDGEMVEVSGSGYEPSGSFAMAGRGD